MLNFWKKSKATLTKDPLTTSPKQLFELDHKELSQWINELSAEDFTLRKSELLLLPEISNALLELPEPRLAEVLYRLETHDWQTLVLKTEIDDAVHFLSFLSETEIENTLPHLPDFVKLRQYLEYPPNSCGRNMQTDFFAIPIELTASESLEYIRKNAKENDTLYYIYCVTTTGKLIGVASLRQLALANPSEPLDDIINRDVIFANTNDDIQTGIQLVQEHDLVALPVLSSSNKMVGLLTVDDVVDEIQEQATADIYAQAGLQQMDSVATRTFLSYFYRIPWLFLNLILAYFSSFVISQFEQTLSEVILLASLMNITAAVSGNTAIQTLTVVTRGLAIGEFDYVSYKNALLKEISVGVLLGLSTGTCAGFIVYLWKGEPIIGLILGFSMFLNSFIAATAGAIVPIVLKSFGKDPAISSGVLVTMSTDIFGYLSFLGIAALGLSYIS
jgi:magnesium transporter